MRSRHKNTKTLIWKGHPEQMTRVNILAFFSVVASSQISPHSAPGKLIRTPSPFQPANVHTKIKTPKIFCLSGERPILRLKDAKKGNTRLQNDKFCYLCSVIIFYKLIKHYETNN